MILTSDNIEAFKNGTLRTKQTHPYNYDPITQYKRVVPDGEKEESVYSDRLKSWDPERCNRIMESYFASTGDDWSRRHAVDIESFLKEYLDVPYLMLTRIVEHCNQATGYPVWQFFFIGKEY